MMSPPFSLKSNNEISSSISISDADLTPVAVDSGKDMEMIGREQLGGDMDLEDATENVNEDDNDEDEDQTPDMDLQDDRESSDQDSDVEDDEDQELRMNAIKTPQVIHIHTPN